MGEKKQTNRKRRGRGEGGIRFREDKGLWEGTVSLGYRRRPDGTMKRNRKTVYAPTKGQVQDEIDKLRAQARSGTLPDADKITVAQLLARWLEADRERLAPATYAVRKLNADTHVSARLGHLAVAKLTPLHVEGFYADMKRDGVGPAAMRSAADVLCGVLHYAVRRKLIAHTPAGGVAKPPTPKRDPLFLTALQATTLRAAAAGLPCCCLITVALATGCRQGELLALGWDAIDLDAKTLAVRRALTWTKAGGFELKDPKSKASRRTVTLPRIAVEALRLHRTQQLKAGLIKAPVFCTKDGGWLSRRNVLRSLEGVIERVNDPHRDRKGGRRKKGAPPAPPRERLSVVPDGLRFHDLRHSHASILLSRGESLRAVSARLGHADPAMTLRVYGHAMPADDGRLAASIDSAMG